MSNVGTLTFPESESEEILSPSWVLVADTSGPTSGRFKNRRMETRLEDAVLMRSEMGGEGQNPGCVLLRICGFLALFLPQFAEL